MIYHLSGVWFNVRFDPTKVTGGFRFRLWHMLMLCLHVFPGWSIVNYGCHGVHSRPTNKYKFTFNFWGRSSMSVANSRFWLVVFCLPRISSNFLDPIFIRLIDALTESSSVRAIFNFPARFYFSDLHELVSLCKFSNSHSTFCDCCFNLSFSWHAGISLLDKIVHWSSNCFTFDWESVKVTWSEGFFSSICLNSRLFSRLFFISWQILGAISYNPPHHPLPHQKTH